MNWEVPDYSGVNDFWTTFYTTFGEIFKFIVGYELDFPEPIGTLTVFNIAGFFFVASLLVSLVKNVSFRGHNDDD